MVSASEVSIRCCSALIPSCSASVIFETAVLPVVVLKAVALFNWWPVAEPVSPASAKKGWNRFGNR